MLAFGVFIGLYLVGVGLLYANQRSFIYLPPDRPWPEAPGYQTVTYRTSDGLTLRALYRPAAPGKPTIVFFHGNGDSVSGSLVSTQAYGAQGYGLLLHEYRGYGGNPGAPDEAGLYADGRAARAWLAAQGVPAASQILMGFSLGTGVATQLSLEAPPATLVLISPYASVADVVAYRFGGLVPGHLLVKDRFVSKDKIARIQASILIMHDRDDRSIPVSQGELLASRNPKATLILFSGHGHQLGFAPEAQAAGLKWLNGR
jgi:pimeloyl-ACP methyl ester carboxylesterase